MIKGKYIVLEGPEGVGKTTQMLELARRLQLAGLPVRTMREPDSQSDLTARAIRRLTQDPRYPINTHAEVLLYNAARAQSLQVIKNSVEHGVHCIVDRNYLTTLAVQYYGRGDVPDYDTINRIIGFAVDGIEPDLCIVMDAPVSTLMEHLKGRDAGERFDSLDPAFLERVRAGYLWEAKQRGYSVIFATDTSDEVANAIWKLVAEKLSLREAPDQPQPTSVKEIIERRFPELTSQQASATPVTNAATYSQLAANNDTLRVPPDVRRYLEGNVSDITGPIYAFTPKLSPALVAATMAEQANQGGDLRAVLTDKLMNDTPAEAKPTAADLHAANQLAGVQFSLEKISQLLASEMTQIPGAACSEPPIKRLSLEQKGSDGKYRFYIPANLDESTKQQYMRTMEQIFSRYTSLVNDLETYFGKASKDSQTKSDKATKDYREQARETASGVLPVAALTTVASFAPIEVVQRLLAELKRSDLPEAIETGNILQAQLQQIYPHAFTDGAAEHSNRQPAEPLGSTKELKQLVDEFLPAGHASTSQLVTLSSYWPRNELDIVADMLYEQSDAPLQAIQAEVDKWPYERKVQALRTYIDHQAGSALKKMRYNWDIMCDFGVFRELQHDLAADAFGAQELTPRYGYDMPEIIDKAGLSEDYERCFELSLELYSHLQKAGYAAEAQYAVLVGHRMRWDLAMSAHELFALFRLAAEHSHNCQAVLGAIRDQLENIHPQLASLLAGKHY